MLNAAETSHIIKYEGILIVGGHMTLFHFVKGTGTEHYSRRGCRVPTGFKLVENKSSGFIEQK